MNAPQDGTRRVGKEMGVADPPKLNNARAQPSPRLR